MPVIGEAVLLDGRALRDLGHGILPSPVGSHDPLAGAARGAVAGLAIAGRSARSYGFWPPPSRPPIQCPPRPHRDREIRSGRRNLRLPSDAALRDNGALLRP